MGLMLCFVLSATPMHQLIVSGGTDDDAKKSLESYGRLKAVLASVAPANAPAAT